MSFVWGCVGLSLPVAMHGVSVKGAANKHRRTSQFATASGVRDTGLLKAHRTTYRFQENTSFKRNGSGCLSGYRKVSFLLKKLLSHERLAWRASAVLDLSLEVALRNQCIDTS